MSKIRVDIDDLCDKLDAMREDDYVTAELEIVEDDYSNVLQISAVSFEEEDPISYGAMDEVSEELI